MPIRSNRAPVAPIAGPASATVVRLGSAGPPVLMIRAPILWAVSVAASREIAMVMARPAGGAAGRKRGASLRGERAEEAHHAAQAPVLGHVGDVDAAEHDLAGRADHVPAVAGDAVVAVDRGGAPERVPRVVLLQHATH